jgi:NAD(P)-dependent dehydrogenase (short-subunit alcohol dehydrogenase family)
MERLTGKVAVITGAGSGIGAGMARACAVAGMAVAVVDVNKDRASTVAEELTANGTRAVAFAVDVRDAEAVDVLAADVFDQFGGCHLLHNNAGLCPLGRSWDHSAAEWQHVLGVNLMGVVNGVNAFVPRLLDQAEEAHIVNTASAAALRYVPSEALYNATKFAVLGLTESLRDELVPYSIGVSALVPGGVATNIADSMRGAGGAIRSEEEVGALLGRLLTVDAPHVTIITADQAASLVLEAVRNNDAYIITHPGSLPAVAERHAGIEAAYRTQRQQHPELP